VLHKKLFTYHKHMLHKRTAAVTTNNTKQQQQQQQQQQVRSLFLNACLQMEITWHTLQCLNPQNMLYCFEIPPIGCGLLGTFGSTRIWICTSQSTMIGSLGLHYRNPNSFMNWCLKADRRNGEAMHSWKVVER
jgi:hypothetical protein